MDSKELKALSDRMLDDEAAVMLGILSAREPGPIDQLADDVRGRRLCPNCGIPHVEERHRQRPSEMALPPMRRNAEVGRRRPGRIDEENRRRLAEVRRLRTP